MRLRASHQPRNPIGWVLGAIPAALMTIFVGESYYFHAAHSDPADPGASPSSACGSRTGRGCPPCCSCWSALPLLFPTGRPPTPRWRIVGWVAVAGGVLLWSGIAFLDGPLENYPWVDNPLGVAWMPGFVNWVGFALWAASAPAAVASMIVRFRRSHGVERQQLKWFTTAAALLLLGFVLSFSLAGVIGEDASWACIALGLLGVDLAVAIAILRHRLYDIDVVINRALVYGALTATLGATYLALALLDRPRGRPLGLRGRRLDSGGRRAVRPGTSANPGSGRPRASTAASTTRSSRSRRSRRACATRSRSTRSTPSCAGWSARRCSPRTSRCGCGPARSGEAPTVGACAPTVEPRGAQPVAGR